MCLRAGYYYYKNLLRYQGCIVSLFFGGEGRILAAGTNNFYNYFFFSPSPDVEAVSSFFSGAAFFVAAGIKTSLRNCNIHKNTTLKIFSKNFKFFE